MASRLIVRLKGGLGNQLFQVTAAIYLSRLLKKPLYLDESLLRNTYNNDTPRQFALDAYGALSEIINFSNMCRFDRYMLCAFSRPQLRRLLSFAPGISVITDQGRLDDQTGGTAINIMDGFFQDRRYLDCIRPTISHLLDSFNSSSDEYSFLSNQIKKTSSVAVHVRRGDFLTNPFAAKHHHICDEAYFKKAVELLINRQPKLSFFVFTDDLSWVQENRRAIFGDEEVNFVPSLATFTANEDLNLMRSCRHHIISNSTFSWWAASTSTSNDPFVIAPLKWYKTGTPTPQSILYPHWKLI